VTLKIERFASQIIQKSLGAGNPKGIHRIAKIGVTMTTDLHLSFDL